MISCSLRVMYRHKGSLVFLINGVCLAYVAVFAFVLKGILRKQGIDYETEKEEAETIPVSAEVVWRLFFNFFCKRKQDFSNKFQ